MPFLKLVLAKTKDYFIRWVGLSYSNPYYENYSAHSNLVDLVQYS